MLHSIVSLLLFSTFSVASFAADPQPLPPAVTLNSTTAVKEAPKVTAPATPVVTPTTAVVSVPSGTPSGPAVAVAEPAAPPVWAQDVMMTVVGLPVVGPVIAKFLLWAGILSSILTTLVGAILGVLNTLLGVANLSGLAEAAMAIAAFRDGKVMYWLRFFSLFNAKKPAKPGATVNA